jgi:hypothetical protein
MGTAGLRQAGSIDRQAQSIRGGIAMLVAAFVLTSLSLAWAGQTAPTDRTLIFAKGFHDGVPHDQTLWIDELVVGAKRIGTTQRP